MRPACRFGLAAGLAALVILLGACAAPGRTPHEEPDVDSRVRQPARADSAGVQVYSLKNKAVVELMEKAKDAEKRGHLNDAAELLERAMRIQPTNPELLQQMAEVQLGRKDFQQALSFSQRSYEIGPRVGEICSRNWRTTSVAREYLGDRKGSGEAERRAGQCMNTKPSSY